MCPHSVSQNGTGGGTLPPGENGKWQREHETNSQMSYSVVDDVTDILTGFNRGQWVV